MPNAVAQRSAAYLGFVLGVPAGPGAEAVPGAVRSVVDALEPWSTGSGLLNFLGAALPQRLRALWGEPDRKRLCAVKRRYDPGNVFALNHNVEPAAARGQRSVARLTQAEETTMPTFS